MEGPSGIGNRGLRLLVDESGKWDRGTAMTGTNDGCSTNMSNSNCDRIDLSELTEAASQREHPPFDADPS